MRRLAYAPNLMVATLWQSQLCGAGIACDVRNVFLGAGAGELPPDMIQPEIWLVHDDDMGRASRLLAELREPRGLLAWWCPHCGEKSEGQFLACWNCQAERPD